MELKIITADPNTSVYKDGVLISGSGTGGGSGTPIPPGTTQPPINPNPPGTTPPPVTMLPGAPNIFEDVGTIPWPIRSQVRPTIPAIGSVWKRIRSSVPLVGAPSPRGPFVLKPAQLGFIRIAEPSGYEDYSREVLVYADNVQVFNGTSRAFAICYTVGNPTGFAAVGAQFNLQPGQALTIFVRSEATPTERTTMLFDWAVPERY